MDSQSLPHAVAITNAEVADRKGALQVLQRWRHNLCRVQSLFADGGYVGEPFAYGVREIPGENVTVQIAKRRESHTFKVMPKRWIVERIFVLLGTGNYGRTAGGYINISLQLAHFAFLCLILKNFEQSLNGAK